MMSHAKARTVLHVLGGTERGKEERARRVPPGDPPIATGGGGPGGRDKMRSKWECEERGGELRSREAGESDRARRKD